MLKMCEVVMVCAKTWEVSMCPECDAGYIVLSMVCCSLSALAVMITKALVVVLLYFTIVFES